MQEKTKAEIAKEIYQTLSRVELEIEQKKKKDEKGNITILDYASWAEVFDKLLKHYPDFEYEVFSDFNTCLPFFGNEKNGYFVKTAVTIKGITKEMFLPVLNFANNTIIGDIKMKDATNAIMRCLAKNIAVFGLGLYIYKGEDIPKNDKSDDSETKKELEIVKIRKTQERFEVLKQEMLNATNANHLNELGKEVRKYDFSEEHKTELRNVFKHKEEELKVS